MLVLTRRAGESFFIGDDIEVFILQSGSNVRVGINAPAAAEVARSELIPQEEIEEVDD